MPGRNPVYDDFHKALRVQEELTPRWDVLESEHYIVHVLIIPDDAAALLQEGRWEDLNSRFKARFDRAHYPGGKDHYHVAKINSRDDLFAINADGTGSHGSTDRVIPSEVASALVQRYGSKIRIPPDNIIEDLPVAAAAALFG